MDDSSIYAVNVSRTTALTRELKPFEAPFLSNDDPRFLWLKHQFLKYFEGWLTTIEVRTGIHEKYGKQKKLFITTNLLRA